jgi:hypothetical protein
MRSDAGPKGCKATMVVVPDRRKLMAWIGYASLDEFNYTPVCVAPTKGEAISLAFERFMQLFGGNVDAVSDGLVGAQEKHLEPDAEAEIKMTLDGMFEGRGKDD